MYPKKKLRHKTKNNKLIVLLASLAFILAVGITGSVAYLVAETNSVVNNFEPGRIQPVIDETFENDVKTNVKIKNTGNVDAYIRAAVIITWKNSAGAVSAKVPQVDNDYSISWNTEDWKTGKDGFYYYVGKVSEGHTTNALIYECKPVQGKTPDGYGLSVEILSQAIQAEPDTAVETAWTNEMVAIEVNADGTLDVTNVTTN